MPSPSPGGVPIPAVPVPAPQEVGAGSGRKRNRVMQSSLELVFSYSRHQQLRYGGSAPSFIDSYSSSRSRSTPDQLPRHSYDPIDEERDVSGRWEELEAASRQSYAAEEENGDEGGQLADAEAENGEEVGPDGETKPRRQRRTSDEPSFFHSDPLPSSREPPLDSATSALLDQHDPHTRPAQVPVPPSAPSSAVAGPGSASTGRGLISINMFSPRITSSSILGTSYGTGSSGSQTPRVTSANLNPPGRTKRAAAGGLSGRSRDITDRGDQADEDHIGEETGLLKRRQDGYGTVAEGAAQSRRKVRLPQGQSTDGQTLFNATAVLVGIGLLSLPLAFAYAGWIGGTIMLVGFGWLTCHTAKLLARLIHADPSLLGYTDIGVRALGKWAGAGIHVLFCLELFALGVALVVLFGDTLNVLYPTVSPTIWKLIGFVFILPTALLPLRLLSLPSLLSSVSSLLLIIVLLIDGLYRPTSPGSLRQPMPTSLWPEWTGANWLGGIGLVLAGFGGHAVMPSLARDMKKPENFEKVVNKAFAIATAISFVAGAAGYLMIGQTVSDEITRDLMQEKYHYPRVLNIIALWMIVINPLTKFGLSSRPLNITLESILGISPARPHLHITYDVDADDSRDEAARGQVMYTEEVDPLDPDTEGGKSDQSLFPPSQGRCDARGGQANGETPDMSSFSIAKVNSRSSGRSGRQRRPSHRSITVHDTASGMGAGMDSAFSYHSIFSFSPSHEDEDDPDSSSLIVLHLDPKKERRKAILRIVSRTAVTCLCVLVAVLLPGFGRVMAFLGSFSAFLICIILPLVFYLRLDHILPSSSKRSTKLLHWTLVGLGTILMVAGTVWAFIPGSGHGEIDP